MQVTNNIIYGNLCSYYSMQCTKLFFIFIVVIAAHMDLEIVDTYSRFYGSPRCLSSLHTETIPPIVIHVGLIQRWTLHFRLTKHWSKTLLVAHHVAKEKASSHSLK